MTNGITKHLTFSALVNAIAYITAFAGFLSIALGIDVKSYLNDFNRGMITGILMLFTAMVIIHSLDSRFGILKKKGGTDEREVFAGFGGHSNADLCHTGFAGDRVRTPRSLYKDLQRL